MNTVTELIREVAAYGATLAAEPPDLILDDSAGKVPDALKMRLREYKPELLLALLPKPLCWHCAGLNQCECAICAPSPAISGPCLACKATANAQG